MAMEQFMENVMNAPDVFVAGIVLGVVIGKFALGRRKRGMGGGGFP